MSHFSFKNSMYFSLGKWYYLAFHQFVLKKSKDNYSQTAAYPLHLSMNWWKSAEETDTIPPFKIIGLCTYTSNNVKKGNREQLAPKWHLYLCPLKPLKISRLTSPWITESEWGNEQLTYSCSGSVYIIIIITKICKHRGFLSSEWFSSMTYRFHKSISRKYARHRVSENEALKAATLCWRVGHWLNFRCSQFFSQ